MNEMHCHQTTGFIKQYIKKNITIKHKEDDTVEKKKD
jgi:hypothetical protein